jgi:endoglucanase
LCERAGGSQSDLGYGRAPCPAAVWIQMKYSFMVLLWLALPMLGADTPASLTGKDVGGALNGAGHGAGVDPFEQVRRMGRGVNILGYDPLWRDVDAARFKDRHFQRIREGGFQTVRINLHAFRHMDAENRLNPGWLKTLDWAVQKALTNDLSVIIDEHDYNQFGQDAAGCRAKLLAFWAEISERYRHTPDGVVFEILNEPNGQLTPELWNLLLKEALAVIRKTNPTRNVVIGPASWNSIDSLKLLELPEKDRHIIVTVHYYVPMEFTHQGARWTKQWANVSGVTWGTDAQRERVAKDFARVQEWSQAQRRPILLGEFGAYDKGGLESRVRYTACVARTAESLGWAWAYWQFDGDFIVFDMAKDDWVRPIWKALIP